MMRLSPRAARGLSMIELLIALAIGSLIIVGAVFVYSQSRTSYRLNETTARLQENARYVFSRIESDIQLAGYYGYSNKYSDIRLVDNAGNETALAQAQQGDPTVPGLPGYTHWCGNNFLVDLMATVQGINNAPAGALQFGPAPTNMGAAPGGCGLGGNGNVGGTDALVIRRLDVAALAAPTAGVLQAFVNRTKSSSQRIFFNGVAPGALVPNVAEIRDVVGRALYVSRDSDGRPNYPALRAKATVAGAAAITDAEILPGVEDMQVQFGIDTGDYDNDGLPDIDDDANGIPDVVNGLATRYVDPDSALLPGAQVVSVRIWLRLRSEQPEVGYTDTRNYQYAGVNYTPAAAEAGFRRILVSRTIQLRNSRLL